MNTEILDFIRTKRIDSFQKLHFLMFLNDNPDIQATENEFAERLYYGDMILLERIIYELQRVGLLINIGRAWKLSDEPDIRRRLTSLARTFENPLDRQKLLDMVNQHFVPSYSVY